MPTLERMEDIVRAATDDLNATMQRATLQDEALGYLQKWIHAPAGLRTEVCREIRQAISRQIPKEQRPQVRRALDDVKDIFASEAADDARREQHDRQSASAMKSELLRGYELIRRQGKGFVYWGTARSKPGTTEYKRAWELSREISQLFGSTTWSGAGPGDMDAVIRGAQERSGRIGGIKIHLTADQSAFEQDVSTAFDESEYVTCEYFATRKMLLVDAAMPDQETDRTGVICLPGGFGSMDEFFEVANLTLLKKLGTKIPVPLLLMNYEGEYDGILAFIDRAIRDGRIGAAQGWIHPDDPKRQGVFRACSTNDEALEYLADYYGVPQAERGYADRLQHWTGAATRAS